MRYTNWKCSEDHEFVVKQFDHLDEDGYRVSDEDLSSMNRGLIYTARLRHREGGCRGIVSRITNDY